MKKAEEAALSAKQAEEAALSARQPELPLSERKDGEGSGRVVVQKLAEGDDATGRRADEESKDQIGKAVQGRTPHKETEAKSPSKDVKAVEGKSLGKDQSPRKETVLYKLTSALGTAIRSGSAGEFSTGRAKYEGRLNQGATLKRVDTSTYKNEFGIEHGLFFSYQLWQWSGSTEPPSVCWPA